MEVKRNADRTCIRSYRFSQRSHLHLVLSERVEEKLDGKKRFRATSAFRVRVYLCRIEQRKKTECFQSPDHVDLPTRSARAMNAIQPQSFRYPQSSAILDVKRKSAVNILLSLLRAFPAAVDAGDIGDIGPVFSYLPHHDNRILSSYLHALLASQIPALRHPPRPPRCIPPHRLPLTPAEKSLAVCGTILRCPPADDSSRSPPRIRFTVFPAPHDHDSRTRVTVRRRNPEREMARKQAAEWRISSRILLRSRARTRDCQQRKARRAFSLCRIAA